MGYRLSGLIAATYTPMDEKGQLCLERTAVFVDRLIDDGIAGLYVCGSTGEGMSLTGAERRRVAEAFVEAARRRAPVIVHVGHNSVSEAAELAAHAEQIGADVVSATAPSYYKISSVELLVDCMAEIASAAPLLPFYYYHIPVVTGVTVDMVSFLDLAADRIANLAGIKYTCPTVHEYQACLDFKDGRFDVLWGCDEMLLSALSVGAQGAVGSTYNIAAPLYRRVVESFAGGRLDEARGHQRRAVEMVRTIAQFPFHPAMKQVLKMLGADYGDCRLPQAQLSDGQIVELRESLQQIGFFDWARSPTA